MRDGQYGAEPGILHAHLDGEGSFTALIKVQQHTAEISARVAEQVVGNDGQKEHPCQRSAVRGQRSVGDDQPTTPSGGEGMMARKPAQHGVLCIKIIRPAARQIHLPKNASASEY